MTQQLPCPLCKSPISLADVDPRGKIICGLCLHEFLVRGSQLLPWVDLDGLDMSMAEAPPVGIPPVAESASVSARPLYQANEIADDDVPRRPRRIELEHPIRRKRSKGAIIFFSVAAVVVALVFVASMVSWSRHEVRRFVPVKNAAVRLNVNDDEPLIVAQDLIDDDAMKRELSEYFDDLGREIRRRRGVALSDQFDVHRFIDELAAQKVVPPAMLANRRDFVRNFRQGFETALAEHMPLIEFDRFEVKSIRRLAGNEADVTINAPKDGSIARFRYRVTKRTGEWKIYDIEDLDLSLRISHLAGSMASFVAPRDAQRFRERFNHLKDALLALAVQNVDKADQDLQAVGPAPLPAPIEGLRHLTHGCIMLQRGNQRGALQEFATARKFNAEMAKVDFFEAVAHNILNEPKVALDKLTRYEKLLGDDADVCREFGYAYSALGRTREASAQFRKSLDFFPQDAETFFAFLQSLGPDDKRDDVGRRFRKIADPGASFEKYAQDCLNARDWKTLEALAKSMGELEPESGAPNYYLALSHVHQNRPAQAEAFIKKSMAQEADEQIRANQWEKFLSAMASAGAAQQAYRMSPDPAAAFRILGNELRQTHRMPDLRRLVAVHKKKMPNDPVTPLFEAVVCVNEGDYVKAETLFAEAATKNVDRHLLSQADAQRILNGYRLGKGMKAYEESPDKNAAFSQLLQLAWTERDGPFLGTLGAAHERFNPRHNLLASCRFREKLLLGVDAAAAKIFLDALKNATDQDDRFNLIDDFMYNCVDLRKGMLAYNTVPDPRKHFERIALDMLAQGQRAETIALADAQRKKFRTDPWPDYIQARIDAANNAWGRASASIVKAWKNLPEADRPRIRYDYERIMVKAGQAQKAYADSKDKDLAFVEIARLLIAEKNWNDLQTLMARHRPSKKDDPETMMIHARAKIALKNYPGASELLRIALAKQPAEFRRRDYVAVFVGDMAAQGSPIDGYRLVDDKQSAFSTLAIRLQSRKEFDSLAALVKEHSATSPADPQLPGYRADIAMARGDYARALADYTLGAAGPGPDNYHCKNGVERARVKMKQAAQHYRELAADGGAFGQVAHACWLEKEGDQLKELIDAHRKNDPDDPTLPRWEIERLALAGDDAGVLARYAEFMKSRRNSPDEFVVTELTVRACVHLKKADEAERIVKARGTKNQFERFLPVLAAAASNDAAKTIAAAEKVNPPQQTLRFYYDDRDLGPILRQASFAAFRERFPEPPKSDGIEFFDDFGDRD